MDGYDALLAPPPDLPPEPGLPDVIPEWVVSEAFLLREPSCGCCGGAHVEDPGEPAWLTELLGQVVDGPSEGASLAAAEGVSGEEPGWATPGVTGLDRPAPSALPAPSPVVQALVDALARVEALDPTGLPGAQALVDAQALLGVEQRLRVLDLRRIGDVKARGLAELAGFNGANAWLRQHRPDGDAGDASLAAKLRDYPALSAAVTGGGCSLRGARQVVTALRQCGPHLDQPDTLIDGQPGDAVLNAVIAHVATVLCREAGGLPDDSPRLALIVARAQDLAALVGTGVSQLAVLEQAFTWLAQETGPRVLAALLDELVMCVLPSELEERDQRGRAKRSLSLELLPDGDGWDLQGRLTLEAGERLWVALRAMATGDPTNPEDTRAWEQARAAGMVDADEVFGPLGLALAARGELLPRGKRARLHDAFSLLLEKFLTTGQGGTVGKAPVQIHVTLTDRTLTDHTTDHTTDPTLTDPTTDSLAGQTGGSGRCGRGPAPVRHRRGRTAER